MSRRQHFDTKVPDADLTPMIDMTFQLIAFFMVLMNFSQSEQEEKVSLPASELAKPAEVALDFPITIHVPADGSIIIGGVSSSIEALRPLLANEILILETKQKKPADANIIIRAHKDAMGGRVQDLIEKCQKEGFEKFALRVKEEQQY